MVSTSASGDAEGWGAGLGFSLKAFAGEVLRQIRDDEVMGLGQRVAYNLIFAIPPMLVLVVALAGLLNNFFKVPVVSNLRNLITDHAPGSMQDVLTQLVDNAVTKAGAGAISLGLLISLVLAIYGAAGGVGALINAFDRTYDIKDSRSFLRRYALQIGLRLLIGAGMVVAFVALLFGRRTGTWVANLIGLGSLFGIVWNI